MFSLERSTRCNVRKHQFDHTCTAFRKRAANSESHRECFQRTRPGHAGWCYCLWLLKLLKLGGCSVYAVFLFLTLSLDRRDVSVCPVCSFPFNIQEVSVSLPSFSKVKRVWWIKWQHTLLCQGSQFRQVYRYSAFLLAFLRACSWKNRLEA